MKRLGAECVYLDISHGPGDFIQRHFPQAYERCLGLGIEHHGHRNTGRTGSALHLRWRGR